MKPKNIFCFILLFSIIAIVISSKNFNIHAEENNYQSINSLSTQNKPYSSEINLIDKITTVSNWQELVQALNDNSISYIKFTNNIIDTPTNQVVSLGNSNNSKLRNLIIDGNGYNINLKNSYFQFPSQTLNSSQIVNINFVNLNVYQSAPSGVIDGSLVNTKYNTSNSGQLIYNYENITYTGAQMTLAPYSDVIFKGKNNKINITSNYTYDGVNYSGISQQEAIESASITVNDNSDLQASNNIYALFNLNGRGNFIVGDKSNVNLTSNSNYSIVNPNTFIVGSESNVNFTINTDSPSSAISLSGNGTSEISLKNNANVTITNIGRTSSTPLIDFNSKNNSNLTVGEYANISIVLNKGITSSAYALAMRGTANNVTFNPNSSFTVNATNSKTSDGGGSRILDFGPSTTFNMKENSSLIMNITNTPGSATGISLSNDSSFNVEDNAIVDIKLGFIGTGSYALDFGSSGSNSSLSINSAKLFNLEFTCANPSDSGLIIRMPSNNKGILINKQDIQAKQNGRGTSYSGSNYSQLNWYNIERLYIPQQSSASQGISVSQSSSSHSATDVKSGNDRVASSILGNFFFYNYQTFTLTKPSTANVDNTANVSNWQELTNALINQSITHINVTQNITNTTTTAIEFNQLIPKRGILIDGNNHYIDFRGVSFYNNDDIAANVTFGFEINQLKMYGQNFYGPFKFHGATSPKNASSRSNGYGFLRYKDSDYFGAQLTASYTYDIIFAGKVNNNSLSVSYTSPFDNKQYSTEGSGQVNIEATNIIFEDKANYVGIAEDAGVFALGTGGGITLGSDSVVTLKTVDKLRSVGEYGNSVLTLGGGIFCNSNSTLNIETRYATAQNAININASSGSLILNKSSNLNISLNDNPASGYASMPVISINSATLNVSEYANLNISGNVKRTGAIISLAGTNSKLQVDNMGSLTTNLVGDGQNLAMLQAPSSGQISFNSAKLVDINISNLNKKAENTNNNLFDISGSLEAYSQKIEAWGSSSTQNDADYTWNSIYSLKVPYNRSIVGTPLTARSNDPNTVNDIKRNYHTENFKRIRFNGYPELQLTTDYLTDYQPDKNSYTIQGESEPNALIVFSGDSAIPSPSVSSYDFQDSTTKFHVAADSNGHFEFTLPKGKYFTAGNIVKSMSFSKNSGRTTTISQKVLTKEELPKDSDYLRLSSVPNINFGNYPVGSGEKLLTSKDNQNITVTGLMKRSAPWKVTFKLAPLKTEDGSELPAQYWFGDTPITPNSEAKIYSNSSIDVRQYQVNFAPENGLKLKVNLNQVQSKQYSGQATWSVVIGP